MALGREAPPLAWLGVGSLTLAPWPQPAWQGALAQLCDGDSAEWKGMWRKEEE